MRLQYKPARVRWLFVGEPPPAGGTFFYKANSNLTRYTQEAFSTAFKKGFADGKEFLDFFKAQGYYLIDLCNDPVNHLPRPERERRRKEGAASLPARMAKYSPHGITVVMKGIVKNVKPAVKEAGLDDLPFYGLPFPAMGNHLRYVEALAEVLRKQGLVEPRDHL